ncbi:proline-rich receptor-like protein kinase PERK9 [Penaeus monodon]|uniref:proline-rich receptor-like protein kinase PERK9 n=1 Tax=Penaeus monodon TaxID=6687 RepID=UPI0018A70525|nr:proline-rich receptor-like protein kinase PERK9 [Penaeus monodon]
MALPLSASFPRPCCSPRPPPATGFPSAPPATGFPSPPPATGFPSAASCHWLPLGRLLPRPGSAPSKLRPQSSLLPSPRPSSTPKSSVLGSVQRAIPSFSLYSLSSVHSSKRSSKPSSTLSYPTLHPRSSTLQKPGSSTIGVLQRYLKLHPQSSPSILRSSPFSVSPAPGSPKPRAQRLKLYLILHTRWAAQKEQPSETPSCPHALPPSATLRNVTQPADYAQ